MQQIFRVIQFAISNFGPLIVFYFANHYYGLRTAIVASLIFSAFEIAYKLMQKTQFTGFFKFSVLITVIFGGLDLLIKTPVFFQYEAAITNVITGVYFGMTIFGTKSFIQEWVEKKNGETLTNQNSVLRCKMLTIVWTTYFFVKAGIYFYVSSRYSIDDAIIIRSTFGSASFYGLLAISILFGKKILVFFQEKRLLPSYPEPSVD